MILDFGYLPAFDSYTFYSTRTRYPSLVDGYYECIPLLYNDICNPKNIVDISTRVHKVEIVHENDTGEI